MLKYQLIDVKALLEGVKEFELPCMDSHKSFYGKALVIECKQKGIFLQSYDTIVCGIDKNNQFIKLWDGYSVTTMRHVNSFRLFNNLPAMNKKEWDNMKEGAINV